MDYIHKRSRWRIGNPVIVFKIKGEKIMQSFDNFNKPVSKIIPVDNFEQIMEELRKPNVEHVKVFMHEGFPSIEKKEIETELLDTIVSDALFTEITEININSLHGKTQRKALRR